MSRFCILSGLSFLLFMMAGMGCDPVAHLAWSPDGKHGAYSVAMRGNAVPSNAFLLDDNGKVLSDLGRSFGSFAWSEDSSTVYFGAADEDPDTALPNRKWMGDPPKAPAPSKPTSDSIPNMSLKRWRDGKSEKLVSLGKCMTLSIRLSPDQAWVAIITMNPASKEESDHLELLAFNTRSGVLYQVSNYCGFALCFTGNNRIAFAESESGSEKNQRPTTGQILEVTLDESTAHLQRTPDINVLWTTTLQIEPTENGLLLATQPRTFPTPVNSDNPVGGNETLNLFHWNRDNGQLEPVGKSKLPVILWPDGGLFSISPDRKRILIVERIIGGDGKSDLCAISAENFDGSERKVLLDLGDDPAVALWPSWHGNDKVTFTDPQGINLPVRKGSDPAVAYHVVDYKFAVDGRLVASSHLSDNWPTEMLPWIKKSKFKAEKVPAKQP